MSVLPPCIMPLLKWSPKRYCASLRGKDVTAAMELREREFGRSFHAQDVSSSKSQLRCADERISHISVPKNIHWKPKQMFVTTLYLTCHDWKEVSTQGQYHLRCMPLPYCPILYQDNVISCLLVLFFRNLFKTSSAAWD